MSHGCANEAHFFDPTLRLAALNDAATGMQFIAEKKIGPGEILYRLAHSNYGEVAAKCSPWWMSAATFSYICGGAEQLEPSEEAGSSLQDLLRMKLAVSGGNGAADWIQRVSTRSRLRVFYGRGGLVTDAQSGERSLGAFEIEQLYIPGLRVADPPGSRNWVPVPDYEAMMNARDPVPVHAWVGS